MKKGQPISNGGQLWVPFLKVKNWDFGFLYLYKGPYSQQFCENEVKLASIITVIAVGLIDNARRQKASEEDFVRWPRAMIGNEAVLREIERVASLNSNVLILGETGVGKEVAADEIHRLSKRKETVIRKRNCSNLPRELVESLLFGYKKGAFTGATEDKKGEFELADGGTIFLDEIGDLPKESQSKLLRVIQDKEVTRLHEEKSRKIDVMIIAATNHDIQKNMETGRFRNDLYYRFGEKIIIPPLRERKKDIPLLAHYFLDEVGKETGLHSRGISHQAMKCLLSYPWHGNARELRECIGKALSISKGVIFVQHLPNEVQKYGVTKKEDKKEDKKEEIKPKSSDNMGKEHIMETLQYTRGNKEKAIKILKIAKQTLHNRMDRFGIPKNYGKE